MKRVRGQQGCQRLELYPATRCCPICQEPLAERYHKRRYIVTLKQKLAVTSHVLCCANQECAGRDQSYRPEGEGHLVLPHYTFGLDVVALIGELRYRQQQTISEIAVQLHASRIEISVKEVELLSEVFLALVQTVVEDDPLLVEELRSKGGIVLSIDGVQPEKGNETLWLLRDVRSGRVLVARNLLSSSSSELEALIEEVVKLEVPILGVISDKQASLCLAVERKLEGVPHQLCHYHYLRDMASPVCEADRGLKKRIKQKIRGIRELEVEVAHRTGEEAEVVRGYCLAVRTVLREDGKYPLEPAGITLYDRLQQIGASLSRAVTKRSSSKLERLRRVLGKLAEFGAEYARLIVAWIWVHTLAEMLEQGNSRAEAEQQLITYAAGLGLDDDEQLREIATHVEKLTRAFAPKLFAYRENPQLPKTNNDLEVFIGQLKKGRRKVTGRKNTAEFILREGRAVARLQSLPGGENWKAAFTAIDFEHFKRTLMDLRRTEQRKQVWKISRNLLAYLQGLEQEWEPSG